MQVIRTYLELRHPSQFVAAYGHFSDVALARLAPGAVDEYRHCYRSTGADWQWRDRWDWTDADILAHLARPEVVVWVARRAGHAVGWYELRRVPEDRSVEIAYFGLLPEAIGVGLGKHLLSCAVHDAWALGAERVWLHTCTLDHPAALPNYVARGFAPYRTERYELDSAP